MEEYTQILGYENYAISRRGEVKNLKTGKSVIQYLDKDGYYITRLSSNGIRKKFATHKLMAIVFLNHEPCGFKIIVDHINNIRTDNRIENLQLTTVRVNVSKDRQRKFNLPTGVRLSDKKYRAGFKVGTKWTNLGLFDTPEAAHQAYLAAIPN